MAGKPEVKPTARFGREQIADITDRTAPTEAARTIPVLQVSAEKSGAGVKPKKPKILKGKLQLAIPLLKLWKVRIAAAQEGVSVGKLLLRWIEEPLKGYSYPPMPAWLKKRGVSEDELNAAA